MWALSYNQTVSTLVVSFRRWPFQLESTTNGNTLLLSAPPKPKLGYTCWYLQRSDKEIGVRDRTTQNFVWSHEFQTWKVPHVTVIRAIITKCFFSFSLRAIRKSEKYQYIFIHLYRAEGIFSPPHDPIVYDCVIPFIYLLVWCTCCWLMWTKSR